MATRFETSHERELAEPAGLILRIVLGVALFMSTSAFIPALAKGSRDNPLGNPDLYSLWPIVYGSLALVLIFSRARFSVQWLPAVAGMIGFFSVSFLWSDLALVSLQRSAFLVFTVILGYLISTRLSSREFLRMLSVIIVIIAVCSLIAYIFWNDRAMDPVVDGLRGVLVQKNLLGRLMALGLVVEYLRYIDTRTVSDAHAKNRDHAPSALARIILFIGILALSQSASGPVIAIAIIMFGVLLVFLAARSLGFLSGGVLPLAALLAGMAVASGWALRRVLDVTGKDPTLSNRTEIWFYVDKAIGRKPDFGYGYGSFWLGEQGPSRYVWEALNSQIAHAHSGFRDVLLQGGYFGLAIVVGVVGFILIWNVYTFLLRSSVSALSCVLLVSFVLMYSVAESNLLNYNSIYCVLLIVGLLGLNKERFGPRARMV